MCDKVGTSPSFWDPNGRQEAVTSSLSQYMYVHCHNNRDGLYRLASLFPRSSSIRCRCCALRGRPWPSTIGTAYRTDKMQPRLCNIVIAIIPTTFTINPTRRGETSWLDINRWPLLICTASFVSGHALIIPQPYLSVAVDHCFECTSCFGFPVGA